MASAIQTTLAYAAASATNIAASQSPGAGVITINGTAATGGVATLDAARRVIVTSGGNDTGITFTIVGKNFNNAPLTETVTGANAAAASSTQDFKTVSSVTHTGSVAGTVTVGTSGVGSSPWFIVDRDQDVINIGIGVTVSGTINYTVEYTYDDPNAPYSGTFPTAWPVTALTAKTANTDGSILVPIFALRLTQNSFTNPGTAKMIALQTTQMGGF